MMEFEVVNELFGVCYELSQRHVGRALSTGTSGIEHLPSCAEAVVEVSMCSAILLYALKSAAESFGSSGWGFLG